MLQDRILDNVEFLRLLGYTRGTLDTRTAKGEVTYGYGCPINAHMNEYLPADAVWVMMTSMLAVGIGMKAAATVMREKWEMVLELVQHAEADPRLGKVILPTSEQLFLVVGIRDDDRANEPPDVGAGLMSDAMKALDRGSYVNVYGVSIQRVLHQLRTNARLAQPKVVLPERFTVQRDDPIYAKWREEIAAYQKLAHARLKLKRYKAKMKAKAKVPA